MDFDDHIDWIVDLSVPHSFNEHKNNFLRYHTGNSTFIKDSKKGIIKGEFYNPDKYVGEEYEDTFDNFIYQKTRAYSSHPNKYISRPVTASKLESRIEDWLKDLRLAKVNINNESDFYNEFPYYGKSVRELISILQNLKKLLNSPTQRSNEKQQKSYRLEKYRDQIIETGSHQEAVNLIMGEFPDIEWDRPQREVFYKNNEGVNKTQLAYLLELIAQKKWPNSYPKANTIKAYILDEL